MKDKRTSLCLIWSELAIFLFFVKDEVYIIAKLVNQKLYFTHNKVDYQRQILCFFHVNIACYF